MEEVYEQLQATPLKEVWHKIGIKHHHGFLVALLGIHSKSSVGCGEFLDLMPLIDWCKQVGFDLIQMLPLNDSGTLSSPYSALSSCALHPIYLSLRQLPFLDGQQMLLTHLETAPPIDPLQRVDYEAVLDFKLQWLRAYYLACFQMIEKSDDYQAFCAAHNWLEPYALFRALKDGLNQDPCHLWPEDFCNLSNSRFRDLVKVHKHNVNYYCLLQYLCFTQLTRVKAYAERQGIHLMGDIPILISPDSADVWHYPHFFDCSKSAGAPPDVFNPEGQYWEFPTYNWSAIAQSDYSFWKQRLQFASYFYHLYRIDHIIGFFRIWIIPRGSPATMGRFDPQDEELILAQGSAILEQLTSSCSMLPIAEDLGFMPDGADAIIKSFGIPGTRVIRLERFDKGSGPYIPIDEYDPINMTMVSTHDLEIARGWWHDYPQEAQAFCEMIGWPYEKTLSKERQVKLLKLSHHTPTLFHINQLVEYFDCVPGLTSEDYSLERMNRPGEVLKTNWTYRYRLSVEEMQAHDALCALVKEVHQ